jgi:hypothetical protein
MLASVNLVWPAGETNTSPMAIAVFEAVSWPLKATSSTLAAGFAGSLLQVLCWPRYCGIQVLWGRWAEGMKSQRYQGTKR